MRPPLLPIRERNWDELPNRDPPSPIRLLPRFSKARYPAHKKLINYLFIYLFITFVMSRSMTLSTNAFFMIKSSSLSNSSSISLRYQLTRALLFTAPYSRNKIRLSINYLFIDFFVTSFAVFFFASTMSH